jgi:hypothetical protein
VVVLDRGRGSAVPVEGGLLGHRDLLRSTALVGLILFYYTSDREK